MRGIVRLAFVAGAAATLSAGVVVGALGQLARQQAAPAGDVVITRVGDQPVTLEGNDWRGLLFAADVWRGCWLTALDLRGADLRYLDLRGACLWECDLRGARLPRDLSGVTYDRCTRWPAGFDPRKAGARLEE